LRVLAITGVEHCPWDRRSSLVTRWRTRNETLYQNASTLVLTEREYMMTATDRV
jgi:hypothetical protein